MSPGDTPIPVGTQANRYPRPCCILVCDIERTAHASCFLCMWFVLRVEGLQIINVDVTHPPKFSSYAAHVRWH